MSARRAVVALLLVAAACGRPAEREQTRVGSGSQSPLTPARDAAQPDSLAIDAAPRELSWYRFEAQVNDRGKVPFFVGIDPERPEAFIDSGEERMQLVVVQRDPLLLRIPVRGIELRFGGPERREPMKGTWGVTYYFKRDFDLVAQPVDGPRPELLFPGTQAPAVDLTGTWRIDIKDFGVGRAVLRQGSDGRLTGTFIPPEVGDLRHLFGRVVGTRAELSVFDGIHGFHIAMDAKSGGQKLEGRWIISGIGAFPFTATRAKPPDTHVANSARLAPGKTRISLPELDAPPYRGNPVIVDYFGSWCPVCIDLTPHLVRLQKKYASSGLQVLSIALEPPGDDVETKRRLDEFRAQFGMTWPFTVRYTDDFNGAVPPEILDATGFPITIFVRRDGTVANVHTGFVSEAAPDEHAAVVKLFEDLTAEIVSSPSR